MLKTDYSSASLQSAAELFLRFISLISQEKLLVDPEFEHVQNEYINRGKIFIERIGKSRQIIAKCFRPFIRSNLVTLIIISAFNVSLISENSHAFLQQSCLGIACGSKSSWMQLPCLHHGKSTRWIWKENVQCSSEKWYPLYINS